MSSFSRCPSGTSFSTDQIGARTTPWTPLAEVQAGALDAFVLAPWPAPSRSPWSLRASCETSRGIGGPLPPAAVHGLGSLLVRACYCACCVLALLNCHFSEVPAALRAPLTEMPLRQGGDNRLKLLPSRMGWRRSSLRCSPSTLPP